MAALSTAIAVPIISSSKNNNVVKLDEIDRVLIEKPQPTLRQGLDIGNDKTASDVLKTNFLAPPDKGH